MRFLRLSGSVAALLAASFFLATPAQGTPAPRQAGSQSATSEHRDPGLYMTFQTDKGNIACKLYEKESPVTVGKMVGLAIGKLPYVDPRTHQTTRKKFFDGLTFHRVIPGFMIQGGDPLGNGTGSPEGPGFPYQNENSPNLKFDVAGRLAMANAGPNTNGSQFFITEAPYPSLNGGYTIWGQCDDAAVELVKQIARMPRGAADRPVQPVKINHITIVKAGSPTPAKSSKPSAPKKPGTTKSATKPPAPAS